LGDSQKNMVWFSVVLVGVNALFLLLGGMLYLFIQREGLSLPPDDVFPKVVMNYLPQGVSIIFILGLISALFPSVDGAITALTSSFCIDILGFERHTQWTEEEKTKKRKTVHWTFALVFLLCVFVFKAINEKSIIDLLFDIAGYTYGPLLGLFAFGILTQRQLQSKFLPIILLLSPLISFLLDKNGMHWLGGYKFGFELLIVNGALTFLGLWMISKPSTSDI